MAETMLGHIDWGSVLKAGLVYSINPASFLGYFLFLFFLVRAQRRSGFGHVFGGVLIFVLLIVQSQIHLGLMDAVLAQMGLLSVIGFLLRCLLAVIIVMSASRFFRAVLGDDADIRTSLEKIFYYRFHQKAVDGSIRGTLLTVLKGGACGIFLAFWGGFWPLPSGAVYLNYRLMLKPDPMVFWKFVFFELSANWMYCAVWFLAVRAFRSQALRQKILDSRLAAVVISGLAVAAGTGMLIYYAADFI